MASICRLGIAVFPAIIVSTVVSTVVSSTIALTAMVGLVRSWARHGREREMKTREKQEKTVESAIEVKASQLRVSGIPINRC